MLGNVPEESGGPVEKSATLASRPFRHLKNGSTSQKAAARTSSSWPSLYDISPRADKTLSSHYGISLRAGKTLAVAQYKILSDEDKAFNEAIEEHERILQEGNGHGDPRVCGDIGFRTDEAAAETQAVVDNEFGCSNCSATNYSAYNCGPCRPQIS